MKTISMKGTAQSWARWLANPEPNIVTCGSRPTVAGHCISAMCARIVRKHVCRVGWYPNMCVEREIAIDDGDGDGDMEREHGEGGRVERQGERGRETERGRESHMRALRVRTYAIDPTISDTRYMRLYASKFRVMCHCVKTYVRCLTLRNFAFQ